MKYFFLLNLVAFFLIGCSTPQPNERNENNNEIPVIDIEKVIENKKDILLSDLANDITYIPLETTPECLFKDIQQLEITESYLFISDGDKLLQFKQDGKFIKQIGRKGRGPGEYSGIMHFSVNEKANTILLQGEYQFNIYDIEGNFKRNNRDKLGIEFIFYSPLRVAFYKSNNVENPKNLIVTNQDLNPLFSFINSNPRPKTNLGFTKAPLYVFDDNLYFKEHYNDTVFCVIDSILKPHIIYKEREVLLPKDFELHSNGSNAGLQDQLEKVMDKLMIQSILEGKKYVFTSYLKGLGPMTNGNTNVVYEKDISSTMATDNLLINDMDGGMNFWPEIIFQDTIMVSSQTAFSIKNYINSEIFKNSTPKYPEKKKELEQLANSLDENDNPVLMLIKLKE